MLPPAVMTAAKVLGGGYQPGATAPPHNANAGFNPLSFLDKNFQSPYSGIGQMKGLQEMGLGGLLSMFSNPAANRAAPQSEIVPNQEQPSLGGFGQSSPEGFGLFGDALKPIISQDEIGKIFEPYNKPSFLDDFFGSMDKNLQSPARLLGVGLLNQMGRGGLGTAGLLGMGLYDAFKSRRKK
jgi:hypothetical protein